MKMKFVIIITLLCIISYSYSTSTNTKVKTANKLKSSSKNKKSMMEFLNDLYMDSNADQAPAAAPAAAVSTPAPHEQGEDKANDNSNPDSSKGSETSNDNKDTKGPVKLPAKIVLPKKDESRLILEDWLRISSPMFKNKQRFPPIAMPDGTFQEILVDQGFFRNNTAFNENNVDPSMPPGQFFFWFRLSGKNIYYSTTQTDINILGALSVINVEDATPLDDYSPEPTCFIIKDKELKNWKLCGDSIDIRNKWVCKIKEILLLNDQLCASISDKEMMKPTVIEKVVNQPIILIPLPSRHCNENWNYKMNGNDWECDCAEGKEQSPIDLPPVHKTILSPIKPLFQYQETAVKPTYSTLDGMMTENVNIKIINVDNALRIFYKNFGKIVTLDGAVYNAEEIVFHTPAEHLINGKRYEMEMQVIHYGVTKGDIAKQVVLSFVFERKPGIYNKFIDDVDFFNLPNPITKTRDLQNPLFIPKIFYNTDDENLPIMRPFSFYTYQGSLSFPPCNERTINYVASQPIQLGSTAIQLFQEALRIPDFVTQTGDVIVSDSVDRNYRNVKPINGRPIFYYDHLKYCGPEPPKKIIKTSGHYEKVKKEATKYFYVNGPDPSGLPGAFLVSEKEAKGQNLG